MIKQILITVFIIGSIGFTGCKTKNEIRREQEFDRLKQEITQTRGDRADVDSIVDEMKVEMARLGNVLEEEAQGRRHDSDEMKKELTSLAARVQALEQKAVSDELSQKQTVAAPTNRATFESGRRSFDEGRYDEAIETLKQVVRNQGKSEDGKKAQFLLAESYFESKDFASAALEFSEFRKSFPKDALIPNAIYRQGASFRGMGKIKEAKLFFQDLVDRYPKSPFAAKAKAEAKKMK